MFKAGLEQVVAVCVNVDHLLVAFPTFNFGTVLSELVEGLVCNSRISQVTILLFSNFEHERVDFGLVFSLRLVNS